MSRKKKLRFTAPLLLFSFSASTGAVLASDNCQVSVVQALIDSSNAANRHVAPKHVHTKAVLASWEEWGKDYLAKHGHAYVPPKRNYVQGKMFRPEKPNGVFKFECVPPILPTEDASVTALLTDFLPTEELDTLPLSLPASDIISSPSPVTPGDEGGYLPSYPPVFGGGPVASPSTPSAPGSPGTPTTPVTPPVPPPDTPTPPIAATPEPGSYALLATGLAVLWGLRQRSRAAQSH